MANYILRNVPDALWTLFRHRAKTEGWDFKALFHQLLSDYANGRLHPSQPPPVEMRVRVAKEQHLAERSQRFNDETGCLSGGNRHHDRCVCQEEETGRYADTPHKHYAERPYGCARCACTRYSPAVVDSVVISIDQSS